MNLTYDPKHNVAYIRLKDKDAQVETIKVSEGVNIDIAPDGSIFGIELLNANEQLPDWAGGRLVIENEGTGKRAEVALP